MSDTIEEEAEAIKVVLRALEPLSEDVRTYVIEYVLSRLQISVGSSWQRETATRMQRPEMPVGAPEKARVANEGPTQLHIKELKEAKKPRSANEMAALVAYFIENVAPPQDRKDKITTDDIIQYFKIASFPLPKVPRTTLGNAKAAG